MNVSEEIVKKIVADLTDRGGLQNEWEAIDEETRKEIEATWRHIVALQIVKHEKEIKLSFGITLPSP